MSSTEFQDPSDRPHHNPGVFKQPSQIALAVEFCVVVLLFMQVSERPTRFEVN